MALQGCFIRDKGSTSARCWRGVGKGADEFENDVRSLGFGNKVRAYLDKESLVAFANETKTKRLLAVDVLRRLANPIDVAASNCLDRVQGLNMRVGDVTKMRPTYVIRRFRTFRL